MRLAKRLVAMDAPRIVLGCAPLDVILVVAAVLDALEHVLEFARIVVITTVMEDARVVVRILVQMIVGTIVIELVLLIARVRANILVIIYATQVASRLVLVAATRHVLVDAGKAVVPVLDVLVVVQDAPILVREVAMQLVQELVGIIVEVVVVLALASAELVGPTVIILAGLHQVNYKFL